MTTTDPNLLAVTASLAQLNTAIAAASPLSSNSLVRLGSLILQVQQSLAVVSSALALADAKINTNGVFGINAGGDPTLMAASLVNQLTALNNEAILMVQRAALGRMLYNFSVTGG